MTEHAERATPSAVATSRLGAKTEPSWLFEPTDDEYDWGGPRNRRSVTIVFRKLSRRRAFRTRVYTPGMLPRLAATPARRYSNR
jgi:hypothetical protein